MNETTILVWINIAIVGIIAIIIVKLYFRKDELEKDDSPLLSKDSLNKLSQSSENNLSKTAPNKSFVSTYFSKQDQPKGTSLRKQGQIPEDNFNSYIVPETNEHLFSDKSENEEDPAKPINFNYETKVQKFQEPINETQMDIMSKNNKNTKKEINENNISLEEKPKHELKDLFSIDELIKESKRKDSEREKESKTIKKEKEDTKRVMAGKPPRSRFVPPTVEDIRGYCLEQGNNVDPEQFFDYYTANGWTQGKGRPIKDWRAAVRLWARRDGGTSKPEAPTAPRVTYHTEIINGQEVDVPDV